MRCFPLSLVAKRVTGIRTVTALFMTNFLAKSGEAWTLNSIQCQNKRDAAITLISINSNIFIWSRLFNTGGSRLKLTKATPVTAVSGLTLPSWRSRFPRIQSERPFSPTTTMPLSLESSLSLYSIPLAWLTAFYPMNMKVCCCVRFLLKCADWHGTFFFVQFALIDKTIGYNK